MLNVEINLKFQGGPSEATSNFLKMASTDGYSLYEDDFDAFITITDC